MITMARITALYPLLEYRADLDAPAVAEGNTIPMVRPIASLQTVGAPAIGDEVLLLVEGATFRYLPLRPVLEALWMSATRAGLRTRTGDVAVILDDSDHTIRLGRAGADKRVVHEDVKARLDAHKADGMDAIVSWVSGIYALLLAVPLTSGTVSSSTDLKPLRDAAAALKTALDNNLSAIAAGDAAVANYTAEGVLVPTDKPLAGAGGL